MSNDLIPNVIEAIVGSSVSFSLETLSQALVDKNKRKGVSSVVPAPKFTLLSRVKSRSREIFLELKEVSGNRVASMCLVESKDIKFTKAFEGYSYIPKLEPNETSSEFLLGAVSNSKSSNETLIRISVLLTNADLNEEGSIHKIFEGTLGELITAAETSDHNSNDLDISISGYSISDTEAVAIADRYIAMKRARFSDPASLDMAKWETECSVIDKREIAAWVISKSSPPSTFKIVNRSKGRRYENLEIELSPEFSFILVSSRAKTEILPEPMVFSKYNSCRLDMPKLSSAASYSPTIEQNRSICVAKDKLKINVDKLRAFDSVEVNPEECRLVLFGTEEIVNCNLVIRDENNIDYLEKDIQILRQEMRSI